MRTWSWLFGLLLLLLSTVSYAAADRPRLSDPESRTPQVTITHIDPAMVDEGGIAALEIDCNEDFEVLPHDTYSILSYRQCGLTVTVSAIGGPLVAFETNDNLWYMGDTAVKCSGVLGDEDPVVIFTFSSPIANFNLYHEPTGYLCCTISSGAEFCGDLGYVNTGFGTGTDRMIFCSLYGYSAFDRPAPTMSGK